MIFDPTAFSGKTCLVTGGSRDLGAAIALRLARDGVRVMVAARTAPAPPVQFVECVQADLATADGVQALSATLKHQAPRSTC